jgi:hypothetical protein
MEKFVVFLVCASPPQNDKWPRYLSAAIHLYFHLIHEKHTSTKFDNITAMFANSSKKLDKRI